ncbi:MurR/RpiR family transcriptional regulator [Mangrovicoccus sp. HB161399]|uniref:MurR/RpiR family transcriptional regulator n=1 Tax=Mangrovicoccus sp. HB161399 TaxID=2720392 RepID=UPI001555EF5C|nr:MurR/RpiR family transcriptional regulator [Mangrovicoccus sp. HB161399]
MSEPTFLDRVRNSLDGLHPAERRLAVFLLNFPGELAAYTGQELAALANVSAPTVSRFIKRIGYANYEEARRHVRTAKRTGAALYMVAAGEDSPEEMLRTHLRQAETNLGQTFLTLPAAEIETLAAAVLAARRVWIAGFRSSQAMASYLHWQIYQVCPQAAVIPAGGQTMAEHVAAIEPEDCVIVFGMARRPQGLPALIEALKGRGAKVAYVSDEGAERRDDLDWHMQCATLAPGPLYSHVSAMLLMQVLATRILQLSGLEGRRHQSVIEELHRDLGEL